MSPSLAVVADNTNPAAESLSNRVRRLQAEARAIAVEHVKALEAAMDEVSRLASEVAGGGESYPVGARELARQMMGDFEGRRRALDAIVGRAALS